MRYSCYIAAQILLLQAGTMFAQGDEIDNVYKFQTFLFDSQIAEKLYGEGGFSYGNFNSGNVFGLGVQGGVPVNEKIELGGQLGFQNFNPGAGESQSGITDLAVAGRYLIQPGKNNISAGGYLTLPIGKDEIGQGKFNIGGYGAIRHALDSGFIISGILGLEFLETSTVEQGSKHNASLLLGGGGIIPVNPLFHVVVELTIELKTEFTLLSGGVDYQLANAGKLRGGLGFGLDDGAPDITIFGSYFINFN